MLKVLLVDDEPIIREGLKTIINWREYGFEVCGEAGNGREGLRIMAELSPDLVIADIRMPVMDGLEMIKNAVDMKMESKMMLLTGYSEFSYALKAIEYGVEYYILKPIDEQALIDKLESLHEKIMNERSKEAYIHANTEMAKEKVIEMIVRNQLDPETVEEENKFYDFGFPWRSYQVMLIETGKPDEKTAGEYAELRMETEGYIRENHYGYAFNAEGDIGILVKNIVFTNNHLPLDSFRKRMKERYGRNITIVIGKDTEKLNGIRDSYISARQLLEKKFKYNANGIITTAIVDEMAGRARGAAVSQTGEEELMEKLFIAVNMNTLGQINGLLEEILAGIMLKDISEEDIKIYYTNLFLGIIKKLMINVRNKSQAMEECFSVVSEIQKQESLFKLHGLVKFKLASISDELCRTMPEGLIDRIIDYLNRNYASPVKLETLAELFNYNSAYLGKLFKSSTGEYFNTYLDKIRIKNAMELLSSGLKVSQAAEKTGFNDVEYFNMKFKKYVGIPPSAYKKSE